MYLHLRYLRWVSESRFWLLALVLHTFHFYMPWFESLLDTIWEDVLEHVKIYLTYLLFCVISHKFLYFYYMNLFCCCSEWSALCFFSMPVLLQTRCVPSAIPYHLYLTHTHTHTPCRYILPYTSTIPSPSTGLVAGQITEHWLDQFSHIQAWNGASSMFATEGYAWE